MLREAQELAEHERGWSPEVTEFLQHERESGDYPLVSRYLGGDVEAANEMLLDGVEMAMRRRG